jgi:hypothetical protein
MDRLGVKIGLTMLSLAATLGGWATLSSREPLVPAATTTTQPTAALPVPTVIQPLATRATAVPPPSTVSPPVAALPRPIARTRSSR